MFVKELEETAAKFAPALLLLWYEQTERATIVCNSLKKRIGELDELQLAGKALVREVVESVIPTEIDVVHEETIRIILFESWQTFLVSSSKNETTWFIRGGAKFWQARGIRGKISDTWCYLSRNSGKMMIWTKNINLCRRVYKFTHRRQEVRRKRNDKRGFSSIYVFSFWNGVILDLLASWTNQKWFGMSYLLVLHESVMVVHHFPRDVPERYSMTEMKLVNQMTLNLEH